METGPWPPGCVVGVKRELLLVGGACRASRVQRWVLPRGPGVGLVAGGSAKFPITFLRFTAFYLALVMIFLNVISGRKVEVRTR